MALVEISETTKRSKAIDRARAETQAIEHGNRLARVEVELRAINSIRSARLAKTSRGIRIRMTAVAVATGIACGAIGYWVASHGKQNQSRVLVHVLEREPGVPYSLQSGVTLAGANQAQSAATASVPIEAQKVSEPARAAASAVASASTAAPAAAHIPAVAMEPKSARGPVPLPVLVAKPAAAPVVKVANTAAVPAPPPKNTSAGTPTPPSGIPSKAPEKPAEAVEVVLPIKARPQEPKPQASAPPAISKDYMVVNVIEGIVIVRQGQSVRQVRIGEKMPDGQTLKSVNTEKGQFETMP